MRYLLFLFIFSITFNNSIAAQDGSISGHVISCRSGKVLVNATIVVDNSETFSSTDNTGYFNISDISLPDTIKISYVGYETKQIWITKKTVFPLHICLQPNTFLPNVTITEKVKSTSHNREKVSLYTLKKLPALGGEVDLMKALTILPSVVQGYEGTSYIYVRGGNKDQNLVLIDGIPVYNLNHLFGYFSLINEAAVKKLEFYKGDMPTKYGNRLSSLVDITLKNGNSDSLQGSFGIGLLTTKFLLEGPIKKDTSSFMVSARSSYLGLINLFRSKKNSSIYLDYWLYDVYAKYHTLLGRGKFNISIYAGLDNALASFNSKEFSGADTYTKSRYSLKWGNNIISLRYSIPVFNKFIFNTTIGYSGYKTIRHIEVNLYTVQNNMNKKISFNEIDDEFRLQSYLADVNLHYYPTENINLSSGIRYSYNSHTIHSVARNYPGYEEEIVSMLISPYMESVIEFAPRLQSRIGLHFNGSILNGNTHFIVAPRFNIDYILNDKLSIYAGVNQNYQYLKQYTFPNLGLNYDIFIPYYKNLPAKSWEYQIGSQYKNTHHEVGLCIYYKKMYQLTELPIVNDLIVRNRNWREEIVTAGTGIATGLEIEYRYIKEKLQLYGAYTLSYAQREFEEINNGEPYYFNFDRRHNININARYRLSKKWSCSGHFILQSGRPITFPTERIQLFNQERTIVVAHAKNNIRLPSYHRLDVSFTRTRKTRKGNKRIWIFSIYNVYNHRNPNQIIITTKPLTKENEPQYPIYELRSVSYFPLMPSIHFKYEF